MRSRNLVTLVVLLAAVALLARWQAPERAKETAATSLEGLLGWVPDDASTVLVTCGPLTPHPPGGEAADAHTFLEDVAVGNWRAALDYGCVFRAAIWECRHPGPDTTGCHILWLDPQHWDRVKHLAERSVRVCRLIAGQPVWSLDDPPRCICFPAPTVVITAEDPKVLRTVLEHGPRHAGLPRALEALRQQVDPPATLWSVRTVNRANTDEPLRTVQPLPLAVVMSWARKPQLSYLMASGADARCLKQIGPGAKAHGTRVDLKMPNDDYGAALEGGLGIKIEYATP